MANPTKGETTVTLDDGRKLTFAFDVNAFIDISEQLGMKVPDIVKALSDKKNPPDLAFQRAVFWGGLQKYHPEMSIRDAGEVMLEAAPAMARAMDAAMPKDDGDGGEANSDPPKPRHGNGTRRKPPGRG